MEITLTVIAGPHTGLVFTFTGHDRFLVGRSAKAHFRLAQAKSKDLRVSRLHFLVEVNPPLCRLHDAGSRNGTFVNGQRVSSQDLGDGDEVRVGHTVLRVSINAPVPAPPSAPEPSAAWPGIFALPTAQPIRGPIACAPDEARSRCSSCSAPLQEPTGGVCIDCRRQAQACPQPLPDYLLVREIGRGSMGIVYLALRWADEAVLAVKTIIPVGTPRPGAVERFLREANILRELDHPHIVRFREMGAAGGQLFFAMDYVPGTTTAQLLAQTGPLAVRVAARVLNQVLAGLEYAHAKGIVHRDVKPANILIEDTGHGKHCIKIADFGLARVYHGSQLSGLTLQDDLGGTIGFMPPEQITNYRDVKPAADQYAAASTLYMLLAAQPIHDLTGPVATQLDKVLKTDPIPIQQHRPDVPAPFAAAIHRALAREPADRFASVAEFRQALMPFAR